MGGFLWVLHVWRANFLSEGCELPALRWQHRFSLFVYLASG